MTEMSMPASAVQPIQPYQTVTMEELSLQLSSQLGATTNLTLQVTRLASLVQDQQYLLTELTLATPPPASPHSLPFQQPQSEQLPPLPTPAVSAAPQASPETGDGDAEAEDAGECFDTIVGQANVTICYTGPGPKTLDLFLDYCSLIFTHVQLFAPPGKKKNDVKILLFDNHSIYVGGLAENGWMVILGPVVLFSTLPLTLVVTVLTAALLGKLLVLVLSYIPPPRACGVLPRWELNDMRATISRHAEDVEANAKQADDRLTELRRTHEALQADHSGFQQELATVQADLKTAQGQVIKARELQTMMEVYEHKQKAAQQLEELTTRNLRAAQDTIAELRAKLGDLADT